MRHGKTLVLIAALLAVAGCNTTTNRRALADGPFAPVGTPARGDFVDGLEVGQRLMAAGEYELALKAYHRAGLDHGLTVDVMSAIGSAELRTGRLGQAERHLRRALEMDETFVPAWNNLGVVLMERGETAEAARVFRNAFALDDGGSTQIRDNLRLALAKLENPGYDTRNTSNNFALVRRGAGDYKLLTTP